MIALRRMFGAIWKFYFWTPYFGPRYLLIRKSTTRNTEAGWSCWNAILLWCRCLSRKLIGISILILLKQVFTRQEPLETWNNRKARRFYSGKIVRNLFTFSLQYLTFQHFSYSWFPVNELSWQERGETASINISESFRRKGFWRGSSNTERSWGGCGFPLSL